VTYFLWAALIPPAAALLARDYSDCFFYMTVWAYVAAWVHPFERSKLNWRSNPPPWYFWVGFVLVGIAAFVLKSDPSLERAIMCILGAAAISYIMFMFYSEYVLKAPAAAVPPPEPPKHAIAPGSAGSTAEITEAARKLAEKHKP
jgi:hypothetical protein